MKKVLTVAAGLIASATLMLAAAPAMARVDVDLNIGLPGVYVAPAPVYYQPRPVYVQPRPVYIEPEPVYYQPQPYYYVERGRYWDGHEHRWHEHHGRGHRDSDGDGVPDRW